MKPRWLIRWLRLRTARVFYRNIPHGRRIGIRPVAAGSRTITARLPYQDALIGNPETGALHGGAVTTLVDQTCGAAAALSVFPPNVVATLDLRLDHLRAAAPGRDIYAVAEAYRIANQIIFVRCTAHDGDPDDPIGYAMGSFMRLNSLLENPLQALKRALQYR